MGKGIKITTEVTFEAAHSLPNHLGKCANHHGHSYRLQVTVFNPNGVVNITKASPKRPVYINPEEVCEEGEYKIPCPVKGMVMDFSSLKKVLRELVEDKFDHKELNFLMDNPTAENLIIYIHSLIAPVLKKDYGVEVAYMKLWETEKNWVEWDLGEGVDSNVVY